MALEVGKTYEVASYKFSYSEKYQSEYVSLSLVDGTSVASFSKVIVSQLKMGEGMIIDMTQGKPFKMIPVQRMSKGSGNKYLAIYRIIFEGKAYSIYTSTYHYFNCVSENVMLLEAKRDTERLAKGESLILPSAEKDAAKIAFEAL